MAKKTKSSMDFKIYSTSDGCIQKFVQVSEPLHLDIMNALKDRSLSTTEIAEALGKAQSTLSVHLETLLEMRLIQSTPDENDNRRKIFSRICAEVAQSKDAADGGIQESKRLIAESMVDPGRFHKSLIKAFLMNVDGSGLDVGPVMKTMGHIMGQALYDTHKPVGMETALALLQETFELMGVGDVCVYTFMPLTIIVHDDFEFEYKSESVAAFSHGVFESLVSKATGNEYRVKFSEVFGTGHNYYKFILEPVF